MPCLSPVDALPCVSLMWLILVFLAVQATNDACTKCCNAGDTLLGSDCTTTVPASDNCPIGFSPSGGQCVNAGARCSGLIPTMLANIGACCYGTKKPPANTAPGFYSCRPLDLGPGGYYCRTSSEIGCYSDLGSPSSCPLGSSADGNDCVSSLTYSCPSGYTRSGTTCTNTYAAFTITTSTQCNRASPATDGCQWCTNVSACLPDAASCPASCLVTPQAMCSNTPSACQWCSAIGVCQKDSIGCFASCLNATTDSSICDASTSCKYCTAIGVCQPDAGLCYATCLAATAESSVCDGSTSCKYCSTSGSIGVCQPNSGTCWATCTPASDDLLSSALCTTSEDCKWCPTLNYCTERTRDCHTQCTTVAPDDPAICQVQSIQSQCQWCGVPGSVKYCVAVTEEPRLRCAASCAGLIWRQDVCDGALECHWCGVHNAAQGGRCKPLPGKSRGYVAWRREVECDTESDTVSFSALHSLSESPIISASRSFNTSTSTSPSWSISKSRSISSSLGRLTLTPTNSTCPTMTLLVTGRTDSVSLKHTTSLSGLTTKSASLTLTHELTATRFYSRDQTLVEAVATYLALGLIVPSVVGGGMMTSSLSRVIAARNLGQCWGQSGSSVFSLPIDVCSYSASDAEQLEGQGDAVVGVVLVVCGALILTVCGVGYWKLKQTSFWVTAGDLSLVSVLTPLCVAAIPLVVGGAVTTAVAPTSSDHPRAKTCGATAALIAVCFVLTLLLMIVLAVVPMATPALFGVECRRGKPLRDVGDTTSLLARALTWFRRSGRRWWHWEPIGAASPSSLSHRMVRTLLLEYRALWYSALDCTIVCAVSVLGSLGPFLSWTPCVATGGTVTAIFAAQLIVCLLTQPMARPFDWYICNVTLTLTLMSSVLRVVYGASTTDDEREDRGELLTVAAVFDLMVSVVTFGPIVIDAIELIKHAVAKCRSRKHHHEAVNADQHHDVVLLQNYQADAGGYHPNEGCSMELLHFADREELVASGLVVEEQLLEMLFEGNVVEAQLAEGHAQVDEDDDPLLLDAELMPTSVAVMYEDGQNRVPSNALLEAYGYND
ncbi:membrane-associated protein, putative [Bodo saltans]|uniref:Membrane-associated protein, putative n=1 Tax=Bodo saltans TaxID=75058 RepID=A0A0S4IRD3_BODSA|nr:membrane-associated protein, putative [Bodo saltans]|eukprot:CUE73489.1 membrane-associated protein, putative [Bodo saltans]